mmetsp:Transcript_2322/g.4676  ORF Transcript_2322/g.4676 Transcript_2322/m.4676 type:complete len:88 (+) Transcript_2322:399-662(+)
MQDTRHLRIHVEQPMDPSPTATTNEQQQQSEHLPISYLAFFLSYPPPSNPSPIPPFASNNESKNPIPISKNPLSITHGQNAAPFADY